tara:strand:+ start:69 stop:536 length:468 start_codon:yes stop_codon:yes gene_type:complete
MAIEIERKFLVKNIPRHEIQYSHKIRQGYIAKNKDRVIRIRQKENDYFITIKGNKIGISRFEFEYPIPRNDGEILLENFCQEEVIEKTRHYVENKGHTWELDVFHGNNEGLIVAEIELMSEDQAFHIPSWIGREVTDKEKYYNMNLLEKPFKEWT